MKRIFFLVFTIYTLSLISCESGHMGWVDLKNCDGKIWININDSSLTYCWDGGLFDHVANGDGLLKIYKEDSLISECRTNIYYGAVNDESIETLSDGSKYVGSISEDNFDGFGVYVKEEEIYVGNFKKSKPDGLLHFYKAGKLYYQGNWKNGAFNGEGTLYKEDGSVKSGEWENGKFMQTFVDVELETGHFKGYVKNNKPDGAGSMNYSNGSVYSGGWKNGKWNGKGTFSNNTDTISAEWNGGVMDGPTDIISEAFTYHGGYMDGFPHGFCELKVPGAFSYVGYMCDGEKSGYGELFFENGDSYKGDWFNNLFEGDGVYTYKNDKAVYDGQWHQGLQDGIGYYRCPKFAYRGEWEDGWINGYGKMVFSNKDEFIGNFVENKFYGNGTYFFSDGNKYDGEFVDGKFNGLGTFAFANGDIYIGEFKDGSIHGDGTLIFYSDGNPITITAFWPGGNKFPTKGSVLFADGDIYEGELVNGCPTKNGKWTSEKAIEDKQNWATNSYDYYKKHSKEIESFTRILSIVTTVVTVAAVVTTVGVALIASGGTAAPAALIAVNSILGTTATVLNKANTVVYAANMLATTASAGVDYYNSDDKAEKERILAATAQNLAINAAFMVLPQVAKKSAGRTNQIISSMSKCAMNVGKKTAVVLKNNKTFGKIIKTTTDKTGRLTKSFAPTKVKTVKSTVSTVRNKFQSLYFKQLIKKTKLYKNLQQIQAKGAITLSKKELDALIENPRYIRSYIEAYTGGKNFQEFFIRLAMGDKNQVKKILDIPYVRQYVDRSIRQSGNEGKGKVHEWLMTKNFKSFLTDDKWGEDGHFMALALTKLVQATEKVRFKNGGAHPSALVPNSSESAKFHEGLAKVIDSCSSKEEVFIAVRKYAKETLTPEAYQEFNQIFKTVFTLIDK